MGAGRLGQGGHYAARFFQILGAGAVLTLSIFVAKWFHQVLEVSAPSQLNFLAFAAFWSLVSIVYLEGIQRITPRLAHPWVNVFFEVTNVVFHLAGAAALAAYLKSLDQCRGIVCLSARADAATSGILCIFWAVTLAILVVDIVKGRFNVGGTPSKSAEV